MKEFNLITNVNGLPTITINDEELKQQLSEEMEIYKTIVFTEEQKGEAKADLATLRKLKTAIDDRRKEVKKEYLKPYDEFESKVKGLLSIIDEPIGLIDSKVKEFEENRRNEKRARIKELYVETFAELTRVTLDSIYKSEWENASYSERAIRADMQEIKLDVDRELNIILSMKSEITDKAIDIYYAKGRNLASAIDEINRYEDAKKAVLEKQEEEAKRKAEEEAKKAQEIRLERTEDKTPVPETTPVDLSQNNASFETTGFSNGGFVNDSIEVHLAVRCDKNRVGDLIYLLNSNGYEVERTI